MAAGPSQEGCLCPSPTPLCWERVVGVRAPHPTPEQPHPDFVVDSARCPCFPVRVTAQARDGCPCPGTEGRSVCPSEAQRVLMSHLAEDHGPG